MKTSVIKLFLIAVLGIVFMGEVSAQGRANSGSGGRKAMCPGCGGNGFGAKFLAQLNLTDAQKDKINSLRDAHQKQMIDLRAQMQKDMLSLKDLRNNDPISRDAVISAVEKLNKSRDAIALSRANHMMDVYEILTPDQRKTVKDHLPGMMQGMRKGMRMHRGGKMMMHKQGMGW